jgi:excisionase family DNA binding protein
MGSTTQVIGPPVLNGVRAVAARLGISEAYTRNLIDAGQLHAVRLGNRILVPEHELQRFADGLKAVTE